ncbi:MAG: phenylalanine--tRNA ligase subunit beta [Thermoplasmatales archaeon]|nr:phenylalanine--tRNA ligase subunit beta [Thermoplasmatales archaeon]
MPVITINCNDLIELIGGKLEREEALEKISDMGLNIEKVEGDEISIEIFPDRPDMLSVEGIARSLRSFFGIERGLKKYRIEKSDIVLKVEKSVKNVRPCIMGCLIKNIKFNSESIASLMELQEKLHFSVGKNRKKVAIGVHDFDKVQPPFVYKGVKPDEIRFVPLASEEEMNLREILMKHEKGIAYAHLLEGKELYPIIVDRYENILSFPPIINGQLTAVTEETKNVFIDVTGTEEKAVRNALIIISTSLAERGGKIYQIKIEDEVEKHTPEFENSKNEVEIEYIKRLLGLDEKERIIEALEKMGHEAYFEGDKIVVSSPPWRIDILHKIDIIEDIAKGYGYEKFVETLPKSLTFGSSFSNEKLHLTMIGLGFNEILTLNLSGKDKEFRKMEIDGNAVEMENPISSEHEIVRQSLIPSLLDILSKNKHHDLPQQIYEVGDVIKIKNKKIEQKTLLAGVKIDARANFSECKSIVEAILRNFGKNMELEEKKHPSFIDGRCASLLWEGKEVGYFGEIKPSVICNFELSYPIIAFEIDASFLLSKK